LFYGAMKGIYVLDGNFIADGTKTAVATAKAVDLSGYRLLVVKDENGVGRVVGATLLGKPERVSVKEFDEAYSKHMVAPEDRMQWWPGRKHLFMHWIRKFLSFDVPIPAEVPAGTNMAMKRVDIGTLTTTTILGTLAEDDGTFTYEYEDAE
jgi:hypothetical protein